VNATDHTLSYIPDQTSSQVGETLLDTDGKSDLINVASFVMLFI
jgi:hypothetical protein